MSGIIRRADAIARDYTEQAIQTLADILLTGEHRDAIRAAEALLDRGHGKAAQAIIALPAARQHADLLASMTTEELMERISGPELPRLITQQQVDVLSDPLLE
jgi:uncharacterized membrane protein YqiK